MSDWKNRAHLLWFDFAKWSTLISLAKLELATLGLSIALFVPVFAAATLFANDLFHAIKIKVSLDLSLRLALIYFAAVAFYFGSILTRLLCDPLVSAHGSLNKYIESLHRSFGMIYSQIEMGGGDPEYATPAEAAFANYAFELTDNAETDWCRAEKSNKGIRSTISVMFLFSILVGLLNAIWAGVSVIVSAASQ